MADPQPETTPPPNTSTGGHSRYDIPLLKNDGSNFGAWKIRIETVLDLRDLWVVVDGTLPRPNCTAPLASCTEWSSKNREARAQIILTLKDEPLDTIIDADSVAECWERLVERYKGKGIQRKMHHLGEIFKATFTNSDPLEPQINSLLQSVCAVWSLGSKIGDDVVVSAIVSALPNSLSTLKTVLANSSEEPSPAELKVQILADEQRRIHKSGIGATAFFAKASKKTKESKEKDKDKAKKHCSHCNMHGHDVSECHRLKKEQETEVTPKPQNSPATANATPKANMSNTPKDSAAASANIALALSTTQPVVRLFTALALVGGTTVLSATPLVNIKHEWITDSGASHTMCSNRSWFMQYTPLSTPIDVALGDNSTIPAIGIGRVHTRMQAQNKWNDVILQDVLFMPDLHGNLLSVVQLTKQGAEIRFKDEFCRILQNDELTCEGRCQGDLYVMDTKTVGVARAYIAEVSTPLKEGDEIVSSAPTMSTSSKAMLGTWHRRFGHLHSEAILHMARKGMVKGMEICSDTVDTKVCEACLEGKQTWAEIRKTTDTRANEVLGRMFSDVCGKLPTVSREGYSYFVTFTDDHSRKVFVAGLREKSEVFRTFTELLARTELQTGKKLKLLRTDRGGEYTSKEFASYLKTKGIHHEITMPSTPQHNGVAERLNRTLLEKAHSMLSDANLPEAYWFDALEYAVTLRNISSTRALADITPEEAWSGNKPDVSHLKIFGCRTFMHIPKEHRSKLASKSLLCTFLGYAHNHSVYQLVHRSSQRLFESCDVVFDEVDHPHECTIIEPGMQESVEPPQGEQRPKRTIRAPIKDDDTHYEVTSYGPCRTHANVAKADESDDPRTYTEAMRWSDVVQWEMACEQERKAFEAMGVYTTVLRPQGRKVVGSKWVFRIKRGPNNEIQKYKAQLMAQGFTQIEGVDYDETFAPIAKLASLRTILALSNELDLEVHQMDMKSAYLNGALKEEIYMEPPSGFDVPEGMVLKLAKAIYGTKQGGRVWYEDIRETLKQMGYTRTEADHAVFTHTDPSLSIIALYVDDITMASKDPERIKSDKEALRRRYEMTDLGELSWILGIHVVCDRRAGTISLSQEKFATEVLERFEKTGLRPIGTPVLANEHLTKLPSPETDVKAYQQAIGALMYLMVTTRPDLAYGMGALGRYTSAPGEEHLRALNRVFRYLQGTKSHKLVFKRGTNGGLTLNRYADANWASNQNDRKSTSGYAFTFGGGMTSWSSKKQSAVVLSSTEAEYIAGAHAVKEAVWLRRLLSELGQNMTNPTTVHTDNQSSIALAHNPEFHDRTKHIDIRHHFLREKVDSGEISLKYLPTNEQPADLLTKGLSRKKHETFTQMLGLHTTAQNAD